MNNESVLTCPVFLGLPGFQVSPHPLFPWGGNCLRPNEEESIVCLGHSLFNTLAHGRLTTT